MQLGTRRPYVYIGAFPTAPLLDDFNRADANPAGGNWSSPVAVSSDGVRVVSNQLGPTGLGGSGYWNVQTFGPDQEVRAKWPSVGLAQHQYLRIVQPGVGTVDGYKIFWLGSITAQIKRLDDGVETQLGADITISAADNDLVGARVIGTTISIYVNGVPPASSTRTDSTYTGAGYIGLGLASGSGRWDDFRAGTL